MSKQCEEAKISALKSSKQSSRCARSLLKPDPSTWSHSRRCVPVSSRYLLSRRCLQTSLERSRLHKVKLKVSRKFWASQKLISKRYTR